VSCHEQSNYWSVAVLLSGREQFSPYFGGAVARWTHEVYSRLSGRVAVTVFGFPTKEKDLYPLPHDTSGVWRGCDVVARIPLARRYEENLWLRALIGRLRKFDIVHIHNRPQWVTVLRGMGFEGAIVLHLHNDHLGHWAATSLDDLAPKLNAVAVCSEYLRSTFASKSAALNCKTRVVYNGVDRQLFYPREEFREPKTIFFVGRFDAQKGVLQLVRAYERVLDEHADAKLVIGGTTGFGIHRETPYVRQVRELARSLIQHKKAQIHFPGYLDHDRDLPLQFQRATIFASPSLFQEPFGLVNAEAMACATTVVGADRGGIPEVIGDAGLLVDPGNVQKFSAVISDLLTKSEYCRKLGEAGYERCRKIFDWRLTAENWIKLLDFVMGAETSALISQG